MDHHNNNGNDPTEHEANKIQAYSQCGHVFRHFSKSLFQNTEILSRALGNNKFFAYVLKYIIGAQTRKSHYGPDVFHRTWDHHEANWATLFSELDDLPNYAVPARLEIVIPIGRFNVWTNFLDTQSISLAASLTDTLCQYRREYCVHMQYSFF